MKDESKTKQQLRAELHKLRKKNQELEKSQEVNKHIEEALRLSETRFHSLLEHTSDSVFCYEYDPPIPTRLSVKKQVALMYQGVLAECNDRCARAYGATQAKDVVGKKLTELFGTSPGSLDDFFKAFIQSNYKIVNAEGVEVLPDGSNRYFLNNGHGIIEKGKLIRVWGTYRDITDRKQAELALRESEKKFRTIIENAIDGIYLIDPKTQKILDCNQKASEMDGYSKEELKNMTFKNLHPRKERALLYAKFKEVTRKGSASGITGLHHRCKNGTLIPIEIDASIIELEGKKLNLSIVRDISERQRVETELRDSEERLKLLFEQAPDAYYLNDLKGNFIDGNKEAEKILGYNRLELIGKNFLKLKLLSPQQIAKAAASLAKNARGKSTGPDEYTVTRKDGTKVTLEIRTHPIKIKNQTMVLGIARDITERKQAEAALIQSEEKFRSAFDHAAIGRAMAEPGRKFVGVNQSFCKMMGYSKEEIFQQNWPDLIHPAYLPESMGKVKNLLEGKVPYFTSELKLIHKKGHDIWIHLSVTLTRDIQGKPLYMLADTEDISDRKLAEEKIKTTLQEKEVMLREIHHRVKNNMQIISSLLRLQSMEIKDQISLEKFKVSQNRIKSMALIHESLYRSEDLAKINFSDYINKLSTHILSTYSQEAALIDLNLELGKIYLDITRAIPCGQILNELLSNAIKHAFPEDKRGEIRIKMSARPKGKYHLIVADNGIGFPNKLDFRKTKTLGLQLVNDLVRQLHGSIVLSRKAGTSFEIKF